MVNFPEKLQYRQNHAFTAVSLSLETYTAAVGYIPGGSSGTVRWYNVWYSAALWCGLRLY